MYNLGRGSSEVFVEGAEKEQGLAYNFPSSVHSMCNREAMQVLLVYTNFGPANLRHNILTRVLGIYDAEIEEQIKRPETDELSTFCPQLSKSLQAQTKVPETGNW